MKKLIVQIITGYQKYFSLDQGKIPYFLGIQKQTCIYYPSCSEYMKEAVQRHGVVKGLYLGTKRIGRCNPFSTPGVDEVPQ